MVLALNLEGLAGVAALASPDAEGGRRTVRLFGAAAAVRESINMPHTPIEREDYDHDLAAARQLLNDETFAIVWDEGKGMTPEQAVAYALTASSDEAAMRSR